jgi:putative glutamine amidotransferase
VVTYRGKSARPLVGLTTYAEDARFGLQDTFAAVLPLAYVQAVHASGGRAVLITPDDPDADVLDSLDGIVFTGGSDVDPALYGEPAHPKTYVRPERDAAEMMLLRAALTTDLPVLGICRGAQLMVVAAGGRLHQHLPDVLGHDNHRPNFGEPRLPGESDGQGSGQSDGRAKRPGFGEHRVTLTPGSLADRILGAGPTVNSLHHQGVADPGRLTPTGWCPDDKLIEVVEDPARRFTIGVQWHPEDSTDLRLFEALVEAAREYRSRLLAGHRAGVA